MDRTTLMHRIRQILTLPIKAIFRKFVWLHPPPIVHHKNSWSAPSRRSCQNTVQTGEEASVPCCEPRVGDCCGQYTEGPTESHCLGVSILLWQDVTTPASGCWSFYLCSATNFTPSEGRLHLCSQWEETFVGSQTQCKPRPSIFPPYNHTLPDKATHSWLLSHTHTRTHNRGTSSVQPLQTVTSSRVESRREGVVIGLKNACLELRLGGEREHRSQYVGFGSQTLKKPKFKTIQGLPHMLRS